MGDPKRIRKKFVRSKLMWNAARIARDHDLKEKYGLKNLRELWTATTEVSRIRMNAREVLSNRSTEEVGSAMIARLARYNIVPKDATIDNLLGITPDAILNRRLQSIVFKNGLARTPKQARQLIAHGFISINGRKIKSAGYMVKGDEEAHIGYYKPINLNPTEPEAKPKAGEAAAPETPKVEEKKEE